MSMSRHERIEDPFVKRSAELYRDQFETFFALSDLEVPDTVIVEQAEACVDSANQFPALTRWHNGDAMTLLYDQMAVIEACERHSEDQQILSAFENVYIAGGIALGILNRRVSALDSEKTSLLYNSFKDISSLEKKIDEDIELQDDQKYDLKFTMMKSTEQRLIRLGVQRMVVGLCQQLLANDPQLNQLYDCARTDIRLELETRFKTGTLLRALQFPEEEVHSKTFDTFTEKIPELTIALCYPMSMDEIDRIISVVTLPDIEEDIVFDGSSVEEVPPFGFHEEPGQL